MTTSQSTTERAQETATAAADEGRHVAGVAKEEAASVASEAVDHARNLVGDAVGQFGEQVGEQTRTQRDRLVGSLQTLGDDLEKMATQSGASGLATDIAREVAERTRAISSRLDGREPSELLDDARQFARNRPGVFLLGALAAGVVAGRMVRGAKAGTQPSAQSTGVAPAATVGTTNPPRPTSTPGQPTVEPSAYGTTGTPVGAPSYADPTLDTDAPMGTPAAGYGERGTLDEERP